MEAMTATRVDATELRAFGSALLASAGLPAEKADIVADILVEADAMGRSTHGLALIGRAVGEIAAGRMKTEGSPIVLADNGPCVAWDGDHQPGQWLTFTAMSLGIERAKSYGTATIAIRRSHHIGCLAAYMHRPAAAGLMAMLSTSGPQGGCVAPFGGTRGLFSTNPMAVGIPTDGAPIIIDTSASITTNNLVQRMARNGETFAHDWLLDAAGVPTKDPAVLANGGTILPAGGIEYGHKGYNWAILVEALTQGLPGFGRRDRPGDGSNGVFIQLINPAMFAGLDAFEAQTGFLAEACRNNPPRPGVDRVRVPGEASRQIRDRSAAEGVPISTALAKDLRALAARQGVPLPVALSA